MNDEELINSLKYLIIKYIDDNERESVLDYLKMQDIPVKGILSDINKYKTKEIESSYGCLIKNIYYYFC